MDREAKKIESTIVVNIYFQCKKIVMCLQIHRIEKEKERKMCGLMKNDQRP